MLAGVGWFGALYYKDLDISRAWETSAAPQQVPDYAVRVHVVLGFGMGIRYPPLYPHPYRSVPCAI